MHLLRFRRLHLMSKIIDLNTIRAQRKCQEIDDLINKVRNVDMVSALLGKSKKDSAALVEISKALQNDTRYQHY